MRVGDLKPGDMFIGPDSPDIIRLCIKECTYLLDSGSWESGTVPYIEIAGGPEKEAFEIFSYNDLDEEVELYTGE